MCRDAHKASSKALRPQIEVADIARRFGRVLSKTRALSFEQQKALWDICRCRTAELGGHLNQCPDCGHEEAAYNSCLNRHCPKCQWKAGLKWLHNRRNRFVPTHHFHVVFTLPAELRAVVMYNRRHTFALLFRTAAQSLNELGQNEKWLAAQLGITAVLHTWTRDLSFHPHLHCVVSGGGLSKRDEWLSTQPNFLFPREVIGRLFKGKFLHGLRQLYKGGHLFFADQHQQLRDPDSFELLLDKLYTKRWLPYCKEPFGGVDSVYKYLARYTHRIAISNKRLISFDDNAVVFRTRKNKTTSLSPVAFLHRYLNHVLPKGFVRIRHYGLYASANVNTKLQKAHELVKALNPIKTETTQPVADIQSDELEGPDYLRWHRLITGVDLMLCPACKQGRLQRKPLPRNLQPVQNTSPRNRAPPVPV